MANRSRASREGHQGRKGYGAITTNLLALLLDNLQDEDGEQRRESLAKARVASCQLEQVAARWASDRDNTSPQHSST